MARAKPPAIFFDLDGTLIDSAPDLGGAAEQMLVARGLPTKGLEAYRLVASAGARGILKVAFDAEPTDESAAIVGVIGEAMGVPADFSASMWMFSTRPFEAPPQVW